MPYTTPAPRYARPIPASKLPPVSTPLPRHRPIRARIAHAIRLAVRREREDRMFRAGLGLGGIAAIIATAAARALI